MRCLSASLDSSSSTCTTVARQHAAPTSIWQSSGGRIAPRTRSPLGKPGRSEKLGTRDKPIENVKYDVLQSCTTLARCNHVSYLAASAGAMLLRSPTCKTKPERGRRHRPPSISAALLARIRREAAWTLEMPPRLTVVTWVPMHDRLDTRSDTHLPLSDRPSIRREHMV